MSRSNPSAVLERPCKKYIKWNGDEGDEGGYFSYYDKEQQKDIKILPNNFTFLVLDHRLFSVAGFSKPLDSYCYSNEVRTVKDKLVIRAFGNKLKGIPPQVVIEGPYEDLKGDGGPLMSNSKTKELKYNRCVYILWEGEICHLSLKGKTMQMWLENIERSPARIQKNWVSFTKAHEATNGKNTYKYAEFEFGDIPSPEEDAAAVEADETVQAYLKVYLAKNGSQQTAGDTGSQDESQENEFDPKNWRHFNMDGIKMGALPLESIREFFTAAEDSGLENDYVDCLREALREYSEAGKTWENAKDQSGVYLKDYSFENLEKLAKALREKAPMHASRLKVEYALEFKRPKSRVEDPSIPSYSDFEEEEDEIPF